MARSNDSRLHSYRNLPALLEIFPVHAGIADLVQELQKRQTAVYLVSGGFRAIINPIAEILKIPLENVYANTILYDVSSRLSHNCKLAYAASHAGHAGREQIVVSAEVLTVLINVIAVGAGKGRVCRL